FSLPEPLCFQTTRSIASFGDAAMYPRSSVQESEYGGIIHTHIKSSQSPVADCRPTTHRDYFYWLHIADVLLEATLSPVLSYSSHRRMWDKIHQLPFANHRRCMYAN